MEKLFETAFFTRSALLNIMEELDENQITAIPEGFRNSIFWNVAHLLVTQQLLLYKLSGLAIGANDTFVKKYSKGSIGDPVVPNEDIEFVKENLLRFSDKAKEDFEKGLFKNYTPYMTSANIELKTVEDAVRFSTFHDGIHLGVVLSLRKLV